MKKQQTSRIPALFLVLVAALTCCQKSPVDQPQPGTPTTTVRIGETDYPIRLIGNQLWTTLNYSGPGGRVYQKGIEKPEYGRYYTLAEAKALVLPDGWRLPTMPDYLKLAQQQGVVFTNNRAMGQEAIKKLVSTTNWRSVAGTNASGFDAQPAGYSFRNSEPSGGDIAEFWTKEGNTISIQEGATGKVHNMLFYNNSDSPEYRFTLRFVRDK
jgi:uncharacterized protein (TIGR02145 family)